MYGYGTVWDPLIPAGCAPTDRACLHREHYAQKPPLPPWGNETPFLPPARPPGYCPPNAKCKQEKPVGGRSEPLITTAGVTDQWWFFPAVVLGVVLLMRRD